MHWTLCTGNCTVHCTLYCKLYTVQYIMYCKLHCVLCTVYCKLHCALYTVYCKLHCTLFTVNCTMHCTPVLYRDLWLVGYFFYTICLYTGVDKLSVIYNISPIYSCITCTILFVNLIRSSYKRQTLKVPIYKLKTRAKNIARELKFEQIMERTFCFVNQEIWAIRHSPQSYYSSKRTRLFFWYKIQVRMFGGGFRWL